ncbi:MAG: amidase, partial [Acidobacteriota bacterium]
MAERPASQLLTLLEDLRQGDDHLLSFIDLLEARFSAREVDVRAFVPEPKRFDRLRREARELIERFPEPQDRPSLFGLPIGVKDIFHAQGFLTRAGSRVPPEELHGLEAE